MYNKPAEYSVTTDIIWKICPSPVIVLNANADYIFENGFSTYVCMFSLLTDVIND